MQTSAMDCGPACLGSLLEGHGIRASYGRLREACHTDVDGTSIDALERVASDLGLDARQVMVPLDHLMLSESQLLPALVVTRQPSGATHFVVAWSVRAGVVQVMDPATGRRYSTRRDFLDELHVHEMAIPLAAWCEWAASDDFLAALRRRMADLGVSHGEAQRWIGTPTPNDPWRRLAALDAATRLVATVVRGGGLRAGREAERALGAFFDQARDDAVEPTSVLPKECWTVRPTGTNGTELCLRGAVLVSVAGVRATSGKSAEGATAGPEVAPSFAPGLAPDLALALAEEPARPGRALLAMLKADGLLSPAMLAGLLALSTLGVLVEALLFRSLFGVGRSVVVPEQRVGAIVALAVFIALLAGLEVPIARQALGLGRRLELRMRMALLQRIARLDDRYFKSRLVSDMADRAHRLHEIRQVPELGAEVVRAVFGLVATTAGIVWLAPGAAPLAVACAAAAILVPWLGQPLLAEGDLKVRNHAGALLRFHLDALLGVVPLRAHAAARSMRIGHDALVAEWAHAGMQLQRRVVAVEAVQSLACFGLVAWLVIDQAAHANTSGNALLLAYWALSLPVYGQQLGLCARQYPTQRSTTLRFLEMLGAPVDSDDAEANATNDFVARSAAARPSNGAPKARGVAIRMQGVCVKAGGHTILDGVDVSIAPGSHVAIVGPSGAGKSSFIGLLLGWFSPAAGKVWIDDDELDARRLAELRRETAWVDPAVQLWNRSLLDNLTYGGGGATSSAIGATLESARLGSVLQRLPDGLQSSLGEGGSLVSGGEGQRVRLGRACLRDTVRLAVLDEPLRGLARDQRTELLASLRAKWRDATLVCVTHDVGETLGFDRVLVVEAGRIVEDGAPAKLALEASRYATMLAAERAVRSGTWSNANWRRLTLEGGRLVAAPTKGAR
ncbi:MAG: cysteine peptidase family C39 domain-containing protein [Planctomycetes bacterium]|nr:cysteine peptidase family C39 domain-containing protein [Planctomycetota bacterium]